MRQLHLSESESTLTSFLPAKPNAVSAFVELFLHIGAQRLTLNIGPAERSISIGNVGEFERRGNELFLVMDAFRDDAASKLDWRRSPQMSRNPLAIFTLRVFVRVVVVEPQQNYQGQQ